MARAMQHQAALLLGRLGLDKPHVGPRNRFADGRQDVAALQLTADEHVAFRVGAMDLKYRRRDIETDSRDCLYD